MTATSHQRAWAVGSESPNANAQRTLVERWDGDRWRQVACPSPSNYSDLAAVSATSDTNALAVGSGQRTRALHWNGAS